MRLARLRMGMVALLTAAAYVLTGKLGLALALPPGYASAIWPPSGIALAAALLFGPRRAVPGVVLGSFLLNLPTGFEGGSVLPLIRSLLVPLAIGSGAGAQAALGAFLTRRWGGYPNALVEIRQIGSLLLWGGLVSCLVNASVSVAVLILAGRIPLAAAPLNWLTWWGGDVIGVFVFTPPLMAWDAGKRWVRASLVGGVTGTAFLLTVAMVALTGAATRAALVADMHERGVTLMQAIRGRMTGQLNAVEALGAFLSTTSERDPAAFRRFSGLLRSRGELSLILEWVPRVPVAEREMFERRLRLRGLYGFAIQSGDDAGEDLFPIVLTEPETADSRVIGLDIGRLPGRRALLDQVRDGGEPAISGRISLVEDGSVAVLAVFPVYDGGTTPTDTAARRAALAGFALGVIRLDALVSPLFQGQHAGDFSYWLCDAGPGPAEEPEVLVSNTAAPPRGFVSANLGVFGGSRLEAAAFPMTVAGRSWVLYLAPTQVFLAHRPWHDAWLVLLGGLLLTGVIAILALVVTGRETALKGLVAARSAALSASEQRFRDLVETSTDLIWEIDAAGRILYVSPRVAAVLGHEATALVGQSVFALMPKEGRGGAERAFAVALARTAPLVQVESRLLHREGASVILETSAMPVVTGSGMPGYRGVSRDITRRKRAEEAFTRQSQNLKRQYETLRVMNAIGTLSHGAHADRIGAGLRMAARHLGLEIAFVTRLEGGQVTVRHAVAPDGVPLHEGMTVELGVSYCGLVLDAGDVLAVADIGHSPQAAHPCYAALPMGCFIGAPIRVRGQVYGVLGFGARHPLERTFDTGDLDFVRSLAGWMGMLIERDRYERDLLAARNRIQAILDNTPVGIAILDIKRVFLEANKAFNAIFGVSRDALIGRTPRLFYESDELYRAVGERALPLILAGDTFQEDVPMRRADGAAIWVRLVAHLVDPDDTGQGVVWAAEDITRRRLAEQLLQERHEMLEQVFLSGSAIKLLLDPETGAVVDANPLAAAFYGYSLDQLRRMSIFDINAWPSERIEAQLALIRRSGIINFVTAHRLADGSLRDIEAYVSPVVAGGRTLLLALVHDITERREHEARLADTYRQLEETARDLARSNADLEQFAYVASHDLRQPLRMVSSFLSLLERRLGAGLDEEGRRYLGHARDGAQRMDRLIVDLLDYSRIGRQGDGPVPVPVALDEVVAESVMNVRVAIEEAGAEIVVAPGLPTVLGDRLDLVRLFQNLIGNAVKYRSDTRAPRIAVSCRETEEDWWEIAVADNGIGIPADQGERVFGVFQRLHGRERYEGTGIGLAICRKVVERLGGRIWVESEPDQGSVFRFTVPKIDDNKREGGKL